MRSLSMTAASCGKVLCLVAVSFTLASNLPAQASTRLTASKVTVHLEADRPSYHSGQAIKVRLTLKNRSATPVRMLNGPTTTLAQIRVVDADGQEVRRHRLQEMGMMGGPMLQLEPGAQRVLKGPHRDEWLNLMDWGYDLQEPGRYTIVGLLGTFAPVGSSHERSIRSNEVAITIAK